MNVLKKFLILLGDSFSRWRRDDAQRLGAALAYYTIFSMAPLLFIAVAVAGLVFGRDAAEGRLVQQIQDIVGRDAAQLVQSLIAGAHRPAAGTVAALTGAVTLVFGAAGVFGQIANALNSVWEVGPVLRRPLLAMLRERALGFVVVLGIGVLLIASLAVSAALAFVTDWLGDSSLSAFHAVNDFFFFLAMTAAFAALYKIFPRVSIAWSDVWLGALMASLLFTLGKVLIGLYLSLTSVGSAFGAAGALVVILVWIYYSSQIFLYGAEITRLFARRYGSQRRRPTSPKAPVPE